MILTPDGSRHHRVSAEGRPADAADLGAKAGEDIRAEAGTGFLLELDLTMRVLVTRPQPAAAATAKAVEARGHEAILLPLARPVHAPEAARAALALPHAAIAVTSAEALRVVHLLGADLAPHLDTRLFCVGAATARVAKRSAFALYDRLRHGRGACPSRCPTSDAAGDAGLLYLAGVPRAPDFEQVLKDAGIRCRTAEVYRMAALDYAPGEIGNRLAAHPPQAILFYSRETVRQFFAQVGANTSSLPGDVRLLCLSEPVAAALPTGLGNVAIAERPNEDSLLALL